MQFAYIWIQLKKTVHYDRAAGSRFRYRCSRFNRLSAAALSPRPPSLARAILPNVLAV